MNIVKLQVYSLQENGFSLINDILNVVNLHINVGLAKNISY